MRQDVIKQICELDKITNVIVLTHNIDFIFLQSVFLSAMKQCGHPSLTIFADAQCARETYKYQHHVLAGLGSRFRVVPVEMSPGFRFHPKAVFLSGTDKATLFVGSGNMTFGGLRENAEIWSRYDTENQEGQAFSAFREYLNDIQKLILLSDPIDGEIEEAFNNRTHEWAEELVEPGMIVGHAGRGPALLDRVQSVLSERTVNELCVCSPYFDTAAAALVTLSEAAGNPKTTVLIQDNRSTLYKSPADQLPDHINLQSINYISGSSAESSASRFIHAKFIAFVHGNDVTVFSGSANCSRAALNLDGKLGNAELMSYRTVSLESFKDEYLGEFEFKDEPPVLVDVPDDVDAEVETPQIRLLAAQFDADEILIGYSANKSVKIKSCLVNNESVNFKAQGKDSISIPYSGQPKTIQIIAKLGDTQIESNELWIDIEENLRSSAKARNLHNAIKGSGKSGIWKVDEWGLILDLFVQDLEYVSPRAIRQRKKPKDKTDKAITFSGEDVFSSNYDKTPDISHELLDSFNKPSFSIQKMLLHAFGVTSSSDDPENESNNGNDDDTNKLDIEGLTEDNMGDAPEKVGKIISEKIESKEDITPNQHKKVSKLLDAITSSMTDDEYLAIRSPKRLSTDIQVVALLLRLGLSKGWITEEKFFEVTQRIWSVLFVTSSIEQGTGWLVYRYLNSDDPAEFENGMSSSGLSAALFAWALAVSTSSDIYAKQFYFAQCISAGQLPWLWMGGTEPEILERTLTIVKQTPCGVSSLDTESLYALRVSLIRKGIALVSLQKAIVTVGIEKLRDEFGDIELSAGDLLWQGKMGICIIIKTPNSPDDDIKTICLQNPDGETVVSRNYAVPVGSALNEPLVLDSGAFNEAHKQVLVEMIKKQNEFYSVEMQFSNLTL